MQRKPAMASEQITAFIRRYPFATMVGPNWHVSYLPFIVEEGNTPCLLGHLAKNNPHCQRLEEEEHLVLFQGPHAYISPQWYQSQPAVPTWNYAMVRARGHAELLDKTSILDMLTQQTTQMEPDMVNQEQIMPEAYIEKLAEAIVGFRLRLSSLEGTEKLGLHRSQADQMGVQHALATQPQWQTGALLDYMNWQQKWFR
ncbi:FMN-binding negative transcriptional regulator [Aliiglaciecola sp. CAU 1673]|nr:FMN-binding negative transcriptional regulator [Aliiglaciecola sp. CAU 1673]